MLNDLDWDTLKQRREQAKATMFYHVVHGLVAVPTTPFLIPASVIATRGHSMKYLIPQPSVNAYLYFFYPSVMKIWNQLPQQVRGLQAAATEDHHLNTLYIDGF